MIIDSHSHLFPPEWERHGRLPADMFSVDAVLERQSEAGIDLTVVSDPHIWYGDLDLGAIDVTRQYNDFAAELEANQTTIRALASATPWRGPEHIAEAGRAVRELGLSGIAIPTSDLGRYLDSVPDEFWELVVDLDVPIFIHPGGTVVGQDLMDTYRLGELCGRPLDTTVTLARFILTGTFQRHPNVRMLCSHAGGAITTIADRLDFGHELRDYAPLGPWGSVHLEQPPSAHIRKLYLDSVTFGPNPLRLAIETVGADRVCLGTDGPPVPFPASRSITTVRALGLDTNAESAVLGGNAASLFNLDG